jgi:hypothetical protein
MKYGEHLVQNIAPEYGPDPYLKYEKADQIITELSSTKPSRYVFRLVCVCVCVFDSVVLRGCIRYTVYMIECSSLLFPHLTVRWDMECSNTVHQRRFDRVCLVPEVVKSARSLKVSRCLLWGVGMTHSLICVCFSYIILFPTEPTKRVASFP